MGPFWTFLPNWAKMNFPKEEGYQFFNIPIIYHCAKNQQNLMSHSWENSELTDRHTQTGKQTDRQTVILRYKPWFWGTLHRTGLQKIPKHVYKVKFDSKPLQFIQLHWIFNLPMAVFQLPDKLKINDKNPTHNKLLIKASNKCSKQ